MKIPRIEDSAILIQFKVFAEQHDRLNHRLCLLGSLKELGAWNIDDALEAQPTSDNHIWMVEVALAPMSRFEWVWLKSSRKDKKVQWERPLKRNRNLDCFSGVLHTVYGDGEEVFLQATTCAEVSTFMVVEEGSTMMLCGSNHATGEWDVRKAVRAREFPEKSGYWKAQVVFDAYNKLLFKWTVVKIKGSTVQVQEKLPHTIHGRQQWLRVAAPWMTTLAVIVDTLIFEDSLDNVNGRSDLLIIERKKRLEEIREWHGGIGREINSVAALRRGSIVEPAEKIPFLSPRQSATPSPAAAKTPPVPAPRKPSVVRSSDIEEHIRQRLEALSQAERLTKQLSLDYRKRPPVFAIKGNGQTEMPTDNINAGDGLQDAAVFRTSNELLDFPQNMFRKMVQPQADSYQNQFFQSPPDDLNKEVSFDVTKRQLSPDRIDINSRRSCRKIMSVPMSFVSVCRKTLPESRSKINIAKYNGGKEWSDSIRIVPENYSDMQGFPDEMGNSTDDISRETEQGELKNRFRTEQQIPVSLVLEAELQRRIDSTKLSAMGENAGEVDSGAVGEDDLDIDQSDISVVQTKAIQDRCLTDSASDSAIGDSHLTSSFTDLPSDCKPHSSLDSHSDMSLTLKYDGETNVNVSSPPNIIFPATSKYSMAEEDELCDEGYSENFVSFTPAVNNTFTVDLEYDSWECSPDNTDLLQTLEKAYKEECEKSTSNFTNLSFNHPVAGKSENCHNDKDESENKDALIDFHNVPYHTKQRIPTPNFTLGPDFEAMKTDTAHFWKQAPTSLNSKGKHGGQLNFHGIEETKRERGAVTLEERRIIARSLERSWTDSYTSAQASLSPKKASVDMEEEKYFSWMESAQIGAGERATCCDKIGVVGLDDAMDYTVLISQPKPVDHRAIARELEKQWGESQSK